MKKIQIIIQEIFNISFLIFVVYLALELLFEGLISNYFDLNILLAVVVASGLTTLFYRNNGFMV